MTPQQAYGALIRVAAQLARGSGLPSDCPDDYKHKTMSVNTVARMMEAPHDTSKLLALDIRRAADVLIAAIDRARSQGEGTTE
jgi:hypothetical protein